MKKNEFLNIISRLRKNIKSPYLYANYLFDYNNSDQIYKNYFGKKITLLSYFKAFLLFFVHLILSIGIIIFKSRKFLKKIKYRKNKIIILGHKINEKTTSDFYFFELLNYFKSKSINFTLFQINHIASKSDNPFLINNYMSFKNEITLFYKIITSQFQLIKIINKNLKFKENKLYFTLIALSFSISNKSLNNLRVPLQVCDIFINRKIDLKIFVTYEGYHWEKILFGLIRIEKNYKNINNYIFALQHSYIQVNNKNFFDFNNELYNPDYLLTSGSILFDKVKKLFKSSINLGSTKKNQIKGLNKLNNSKFIIFLPSSNKNELNYLFDLLLSIHEYFPNYRYIWRSHPFMSSDLKKLSKKYSNIEFSNNELDYDLRRSKLAFYSISSSIITAVCYGVRPVYVKNTNFNIDPLEELSNPWKQKLNSYKDINNFLNYDNNKQLLKYMKISSQYYKNYFESFNKSKINKLLNAKI